MYKPPIVFFGFNRPDCTKEVFGEIRRYQPALLLLIADGPRLSVETDAERCHAVRNIMREVDWKCEVRTNFSSINLGCKKRISSGIDWVFSEVDEAIFLEDDCVPSPDFFRFAAAMLERYRDDRRIAHITGTNVQNGCIRGQGAYYYSRFIHVWGWASWKRAWRHYDVQMATWPAAKREQWLSTFLQDPFEVNYWSDHFDATYRGKINTWDHQWSYACWRQKGAAVIPNANLIINIGSGPDATHTKSDLVTSPVGQLGSLQPPNAFDIDAKADRYTFEHHYGGSKLKHESRVTTRTRNLLGSWRRTLFRPSAKQLDVP